MHLQLSHVLVTALCARESRSVTAMADSPVVEAGAGTSAGAGTRDGAGTDTGGEGGPEASLNCASVHAYTLNVSLQARSCLFFARQLVFPLPRRLLPP